MDDLKEVDEWVRKERQLVAAKRLLAIDQAQKHLIPYMQLGMPDPNANGDPEFSRYEITPLTLVLADIIQRVEKDLDKETGLKRVCVSVGPQHGKSEILSRAAPAWISGRNPYRNIMLGSYNQDFANDFGNDVKNYIQRPSHRQVFPDHVLTKTDVKHLITKEGGQLNFVGVGGSGSGKPADLFIVDDPIRSDADAQSETYRENIWKWFNGVVFARLKSRSAVVVVHTRWSEDDLIGRLCDPSHPERNKKYAGIAERWTHINLPAVVTDPEMAKSLDLDLKVQDDPLVVQQFGKVPMSALWPKEKGLPLLAEAKQQDARVFGALYMGEPAPDDGDYFKADWLQTYGPADLPKNLRNYAASDHAVSTKSHADPTCMGIGQVDEHDNLWISPDLVWRKMETDETVREIIRLMKAHDPFLWWMESEMISKAFGPFLRKEMAKQRVYCAIDQVTPAADKMTRARSIQGRMAMRKVFFPAFAPWWAEARSQLLRFPYGANDDFVDFIAHMGLGLNKQIKPEEVEATNSGPVTGSVEWIMESAKLKAAQVKREKTNAGW